MQQRTHTARDAAEVIHTWGRMEKGAALPQLWRMAAMFTGRSCKEAVLMTTKRIIPWVGVSREEFFWAISPMAARPRGVAAFPRPNKLAERLREIFPWMDSSPLYSGNSRPMTGAMAWASSRERPLSSAIFKNPSQAHILPNRNKESSTACWEPSSRAVESSPRWPVHRAHTTLRRTMPHQMKFNTASPSFSQNRPLTLSGKKCIVRTYLSAGEEHHTRKEPELCCLEKRSWTIGTIF